ncbi:hypothetical protein NDU88_004988 [Pleurodeles waltl]|uniref:Uncharacterized protein n=1 Tax=Pleurodeles waltl TaxID=8319 RepID=A0AAV7NNW9_PLEWA|nr:hypothetical protein NDU88_004988 [Pleurodeles waltl]
MLDKLWMCVKRPKYCVLPDVGVSCGTIQGEQNGNYYFFPVPPPAASAVPGARSVEHSIAQLIFRACQRASQFDARLTGNSLPAQLFAALRLERLYASSPHDAGFKGQRCYYRCSPVPTRSSTGFVIRISAPRGGA